jgi:hypothetical protein
MSYAALIRPVIDRVYVGLRSAGRDRIQAVYDNYKIRPGFESSFYFGLLARPMPADSFAAVTTYSGPDMAAEFWDRKLIETMPGLAVVPRLAELVGRLLQAGRATGGPAFQAMAPVFEPPDAAPAMRLTTRLGALRHHRGDAHRAAWDRAGLTLSQLRALPANSRQRQAVEDETNRLDDPIYQALTPRERDELLAGLGALPG